jgi:hypothetical protein
LNNQEWFFVKQKTTGAKTMIMIPDEFLRPSFVRKMVADNKEHARLISFIKLYLSVCKRKIKALNKINKKEIAG